MSKPTAMRPIVRARIENWQSHEDSEFELAPSGINLVTGTSHAGKSALVRAISFALHNKTPNSRFVRFGKDNASVKLWFSDGVEVERVKGKKNSVYVRFPKGHPEHPEGAYFPFDNIGPDGLKSYKPEVLSAVGHPPVDRWHGPVSLAAQKAPEYLIDLTDTELPRAMSEMAGIDDMEAAAKELGRRAKAADRKAKEAEGRVARIDGQLAQYDGLDDQIAGVAALRAEFDAIDAGIEEAAEARELLDELDELAADEARWGVEVARLAAVAALAGEGEAAQALFDAAEAARRALVAASGVDAQIAFAEAGARGADAVLAAVNQASLSELAEGLQRAADARGLAEQAADVAERGRRASAEAKAWTATLEECEGALASLVRDLEASGELCGQCGQLVGTGVAA